MAATTVSEDIELDPRPIGTQRDAGADEFRRPEIAVEFATATVANGGTLNLGSVPDTGATFIFTIRNPGYDPLDLTGTPPVLLTPGVNCAPATAVTLQPQLLTLSATASTAFTSAASNMTRAASGRSSSDAL